METCPKNKSCPVAPNIVELISLTTALKNEDQTLTLGQQKFLNRLSQELIIFELRCLNGLPLHLREIKRILQEDMLHTNLHHPTYIEALGSVGLTNRKVFR